MSSPDMTTNDGKASLRKKARKGAMKKTGNLLKDIRKGLGDQQDVAGNII